ncbi:restriction endonuclease subunit S [Enterococcus faecium]|uniref:restriction endonuclease subunit S n=1 Tax=Enterococcus faecium TaxID=1352 RepID=UPI00292D3E51|nr:restriction endonuclease subunit S [Enterococcus faecium]
MSNNTQPEIRFPGFTEAWEQRKFKDFTKISQGLQIAISNRFLNEGENRLFYITNEFLNPSSSVKYYIENAPETVIANSDDILMTRTGNTGKVVTNVHGAFHNNFFKIAYDKSKTNKLFLFYLLNSNYIQNEIRIGAGSSTIPDLKHPNFYKINVNTTSLEEQTKIGNFFKSLDDTIALHQRKLDLLKETKKGFLQKMFPKNGAKVPEIRFPGFTEDWEERKLGGIGKTYTGLTGKSKEDFGHGDAKFVTYMNVFQNPKATLEQLENVEIDPRQNEVKKGDVFFTTSSETPEEVGMSSVWTHDINNIYLNSFTFAYRPTIKFDLDYLAFMLRSQSVRKKIIYLAQGISRYNISKTKMMDISVPIPVNFEEQQKIGNFFKQLDDTITLHQRKLDLLKETKKGFLQKMFV